MAQQDLFAPGEALKNADILYVDEDSRRRDAMRRLLLSLGVRSAQLADSGNAGLSVLASSDIAVVLVEHRMAQMDGITFIRHIRNVSRYPKSLVPALLIGNSIGPEIAKAAFSAGANHVLAKPVVPATLYERLVWALQDNRPFAIQDGHYVIKRMVLAGTKPAAA